MLNNIKVVFMGTPLFCVPLLKKLNEITNVVLVVTKPDKEIGRKQKVIYSPVKEFAMNNNIDVFQPENIKQDYNRVLDYKPDIIITCAYGQIIPEVILNYPKYGCINVHASLLPKLRGGAPIHRAIIDGYDKTGITIMYMDKNMDTGDIISLKDVSINKDDTASSLHDKLQQISVELLEETLPKIINGTNDRIKQDSNKATYAYNIKRDDEHIIFDNNSIDIYNQIRGLNSWPGAYAILDGKNIKVWSSKIISRNSKDKSGTIIDVCNEGILVSTNDGSILLTEIQPDGKRRMNIKDFVNGIKKEEYIGKVFE